MFDLIYSNKGLLPWQAGCTWIEEGKVTVQLRTHFKKHERYLGLYSKEEIVAHEKVHAARSHLDEPLFEEILAYRTSKSPFRRYFGPVFRSSKESLLFFVVLSAFTLSSFLSPLFMGLAGLILGGLSLFGVVRLVRLQRLFHRALAKVNDEQKLIPLTDAQILELGKN